MPTTTTTATATRKRAPKASTKGATTKGTPDRFGTLAQAVRETVAAADAIGQHQRDAREHRVLTFVTFACTLGRAVAMRPAGVTHAALATAVKAERPKATGTDKGTLSKADTVWTHVLAPIPADEREAFARRWHAAGATKAKAYAAAVAVRDGTLTHADVIEATKADTIPGADRAQGGGTPRRGRDRNPDGQARAMVTAGEDAAGSALASELGTTYAETVAVALALLGSARAAAKAAKAPHATLADVRAFGLDALTRATAPKRTRKAPTA